MSEASKLRRECEGRTKSERDIDRVLFTHQRKLITEKQSSKAPNAHERALLKKMKLNNGLALNLKKDEEEEQEDQDQIQSGEDRSNNNNITNNNNEDQEKSNNNNVVENTVQQPAQVAPHEALDKIIKSLSNPQKIQKAIGLVSKIVDKAITQIKPQHWLECVYEIWKNRANVNRKTRPEVQEIFQTLEKYFAQIIAVAQTEDKQNSTTSTGEQTKQETEEQQSPKITLGKEEWEIFRILSVWGVSSLQMQTDDSFIFNNSINKLNKLIERVEQAHNEQQERAYYESNISQQQQLQQQQQNLQEQNQNVGDQEESKANSDQNNNYSKEILNLTQQEKARIDLEKQILFECIQLAVDYYKFEWAKTSVKQILSDSFQNKSHLWNEQQLKALEESMDVIHRMQNESIANNKKRDFRDSQIMSDAQKSKNQVVDGRTTRYVFGDGHSKWNCKQVGL